MQAKDYFVHESTYVDEPCVIGPDTRIWHFSHMMRNSRIDAVCNIGQNEVFSPYVVIGSNVKIQNNVSQGIGSEVYYPLPLHLQPCYADLAHKKCDFPEGEKHAEESLHYPFIRNLPAKTSTTLAIRFGPSCP